VISDALYQELQPCSVSCCPIFVIGVARSGTSLLSLLLDAHSAIAIPYESHFIVPFAGKHLDFSTTQSRTIIVQEILRQKYVKHWDVKLEVDDFDIGNCSSLANTIHELYSAYARKRGKLIWGDKTPSYVTEIDTLHRLFPNAKYIHLIRDGRDVAASLQKQWWGPKDFVSAIEYWERSVVLATKMLRMLPSSQRIMLRFEDLIINPEEEIQKVLSFLGLEYEESMLNSYYQSTESKVGSRATLHHSNLAHPPSKDQCFKWKRTLPKADQAIAHEIAGRLLKDLGYEPGTERSNLKLFRKCYHRMYESVCWQLSNASRNRSKK